MYTELIKNIRPGNKYARDLVRVCVFGDELAKRIGDYEVYISEFVAAKILGYINHLDGHPEVGKEFLVTLPDLLKHPKEILMRTDRPNERYIICGIPDHRVVLEIARNHGVTEINTVHLIRERNLEKLEHKCIFL